MIPPCIDPTSAKNIELPHGDVDAILGAAVSSRRPADVEPSVWRLPNIGAVHVRNRASAIEEAHVPLGVPLVVQILGGIG